MICRRCDEIDHEQDIDVCPSCTKELEEHVSQLMAEVERLRVIPRAVEELWQWANINSVLPRFHPGCMGNGPRRNPVPYKEMLTKMQSLGLGGEE
jgi:hypothetical protein